MVEEQVASSMGTFVDGDGLITMMKEKDIMILVIVHRRIGPTGQGAVLVTPSVGNETREMTEILIDATGTIGDSTGETKSRADTTLILDLLAQSRQVSGPRILIEGVQQETHVIFLEHLQDPQPHMQPIILQQGTGSATLWIPTLGAHLSRPSL